MTHTKDGGAQMVLAERSSMNSKIFFFVKERFTVVSKLKVEFNYSTIQLLLQLFNYWHFIINVFQKSLPRGFRVSGVRI